MRGIISSVVVDGAVGEAEEVFFRVVGRLGVVEVDGKVLCHSEVVAVVAGDRLLPWVTRVLGSMVKSGRLFSGTRDC